MMLDLMQEMQASSQGSNLLLPVAGIGLIGASIGLCREQIVAMVKSWRHEPSLMNFSSQGALLCVCGSQYPKDLAADRRHTCRSCGCEIMPQNEERLNLQVSRSEIKSIAGSLRKAAIRASHLELPPSVTTVHDLHDYLNSREQKVLKVASSESGIIEQQPIQ